MDHTLTMHILETDQHASNYKLGFSFVEALFARLVIPDIAASYEVCHQIDVLVVHKRVKHIDQEPQKVKMSRIIVLTGV